MLLAVFAVTTSTIDACPARKVMNAAAVGNNADIENVAISLNLMKYMIRSIWNPKVTMAVSEHILA